MIIEKLTAKMVNSAHLEDRKAAAQTIKSLARSHRLVREAHWLIHLSVFSGCSSILGNWNVGLADVGR